MRLIKRYVSAPQQQRSRQKRIVEFEKVTDSIFVFRLCSCVVCARARCFGIVCIFAHTHVISVASPSSNRTLKLHQLAEYDVLLSCSGTNVSGVDSVNF